MENFIEIINKQNGPSGRMYNEKYVKNNYIEIYESIMNYCQSELINLPFKEKVYHYVHDIKDDKICKNPNCNNLVKYKNSTLGYYEYCSNKCISSDPNIKKIKEEKSFKKYGTKAPGMNQEIKNKIIETNNKKYGHNSPLQNNDIKNKAKSTFIKNYGVDNPNKSDVLLKRRIKTYSKNMRLKFLETYKNIGIYDIDYENNKMYFHCSENHDFEISIDLFHNRRRINTMLCTICNPLNLHVSGLEKDLQKFIIESYNGVVLLNDKNIIKPYELDVYLPELNLAVEFNGLFYHSEKCVEKEYHLNKTNLCEKQNIKLIQIFEDQWNDKKEIIKNLILKNINKTTNLNNDYKILRLIDEVIIKNHINEICLIEDFSDFCFGLFLNEKIQAFISFKKSIEHKYEIINYAEVTSGCFDILFDYFIENYNPKEVLFELDRFFYSPLQDNFKNFKINSYIEPDYYYLINKSRENKNKYTEKDAIKNKIYKIYDSGKLKLIYQKQ